MPVPKMRLRHPALQPLFNPWQVVVSTAAVTWSLSARVQTPSRLCGGRRLCRVSAVRYGKAADSYMLP